MDVLHPSTHNQIAAYDLVAVEVVGDFLVLQHPLLWSDNVDAELWPRASVVGVILEIHIDRSDLPDEYLPVLTPRAPAGPVAWFHQKSSVLICTAVPTVGLALRLSITHHSTGQDHSPQTPPRWPSVRTTAACGLMPCSVM